MDKQISHSHSRVFTAGEKEEFIATDNRPDFDGACRAALHYAKRLFGLNDNGYLTNVSYNDRTTDLICTEFVSYKQTGVFYEYKFNVWVHREKD